MSDLILHAVLEMPPALWRDDPLDVAQRHGRYLQASERIKNDAKEIAGLRQFAQKVMEAWPMGGIDGGELQEIAVECGLLRPEERREPCGEQCVCAEYATQAEFERGVTCYRYTDRLKACFRYTDQMKGGDT